MSDTVRCHCRRKAVTGLRCSRCETPICPECSVSAVVGMICRECAGSRQSPLFQIGIGRLALAYLICLSGASFAGWLLISVGMGFGFFGLFLSFFYGLGVAEMALRTTGRKRGTKIEILAGVSAGIGVAVGTALTLWDPVHCIHPIHILMSPIFYVSAIIAIVSAVNRIRNI